MSGRLLASAEVRYAAVRKRPFARRALHTASATSMPARVCVRLSNSTGASAGSGDGAGGCPTSCAPGEDASTQERPFEGAVAVHAASAEARDLARGVEAWNDGATVAE